VRNKPVSDKLLTTEEVANRLNVSPNTVRYWIRNKSLDAVNIQPTKRRAVYRVKESTLKKIVEKDALLDAIAENETDAYENKATYNPYNYGKVPYDHNFRDEL
jgi:excisionase family DNA binding protein